MPAELEVRRLDKTDSKLQVRVLCVSKFWEDSCKLSWEFIISDSFLISENNENGKKIGRKSTWSHQMSI